MLTFSLALNLVVLFPVCTGLLMRGPRMASVLLGLQVVYKVTTPFTVGTLKNPVVISNLVIAATHLVTLYVVVLPALAH